MESGNLGVQFCGKWKPGGKNLSSKDDHRKINMHSNNLNVCTIHRFPIPHILQICGEKNISHTWKTIQDAHRMYNCVCLSQQI